MQNQNKVSSKILKSLMPREMDRCKLQLKFDTLSCTGRLYILQNIYREKYIFKTARLICEPTK